MNKRYLISILILVTTIFVDQLSKSLAYGKVSVHLNQGFIMGMYSELPESLRIVALGSFSGFIFFLYIFLMFIIPARARLLKYGLSLLIGGIFGNVIDKIVTGRTVDFIPFRLGSFYTMFNLADVFQWVGAALILWVIFRRERLVWYPESNRQNYLINTKDQIRVALHYTLIAFSTSLMLGVFCFAFFNTALGSMEVGRKNLMLSFFVTYSILTMLFCSMSFVAGIIISHRTSGPLYAFEKYLNDLMEGRDRKLKFRDNDHYKHLEKVADKLRVHFLSDKD